MTGAVTPAETEMEQEPVRWLYALQHFGIKLGLDSIRTLLARLGRPDTAYRSVLVGGTNGKGSVAAMLDGMLGASGKRAGLFTSPHLVRPNERIRIGGRDISDPDLDRILRAMREACERAVAEGDLEVGASFFEVATAAALTAFRETGVDAAVLEIGMGGRLDATNAVDASLSVIVTVDLDHTGRLGETLDRIAWEKAGIVKAGRTVVSGVVQPEAVSVIRGVCRERGADLVEARRTASLSECADGSFAVETARACYDGLRLALPGVHQRENARVAVVAFEHLAREMGMAVRPDDVRRGLARVRWPGRLQWIPGTPPILLDGAHNPAGAAMLGSYLDGLDHGPPVLVFGSMREKTFRAILAPLVTRVSRIILTRPSVDRSVDPADLARALPRLAPRLDVVPEPGAAVERARSLTAPGAFVLVAGSLYLVGDVLGYLEGRPVPGPVPM